jgi:hypothetical protein
VRIRSDRRYRLDASPAVVWDAMARPEDFRTWWPWLGAFDGRQVAPGERWQCVVQPPLPYRLGFVVAIGEVVTGECVTATVSGDIEGAARIDLGADEGGSILRLRAELAPSNPALRVVARLAQPLVRFGHDWVLDTGFRQFTAHLERTDPTDAPAT